MYGNPKVKWIPVLASTMALFAMTLGCDQESDEIYLGVDDDARIRKIVNGEETDYLSWQSVVGVIAYGETVFSTCSGIVIDPHVVLTAGHCVYYPEEGIDAVSHPESLEIQGGANITDDPMVFSRASHVTLHPTYEFPDFAIIETEDPLYFLTPIPLRNFSVISEGENGIIVGYGLSSDDESTIGIHRMGEAEVVYVGKTQITAAGPADGHSGDSGGPLLTFENGEWVVTGVHSNAGGLYVNTVYYTKWINDVLKGYTNNTIPFCDDVFNAGTDLTHDFEDRIQIPAQGCEYKIQSGAEVRITAGEKIWLRPGFHAAEQAYFKASISN